MIKKKTIGCIMISAIALCLLSGCGEKSKYPKITNATVDIHEDCKIVAEKSYDWIDFSYCDTKPEPLFEPFAMSLYGKQLVFSDFYFNGFCLQGTIIQENDKNYPMDAINLDAKYYAPIDIGDIAAIDVSPVEDKTTEYKNITASSRMWTLNLYVDGEALNYPIELKLMDATTEEEKNFVVNIPIKRALEAKDFTFTDAENNVECGAKLTPLGVFIEGYDISCKGKAYTLKITYDGQVIDARNMIDCRISYGNRLFESNDGLSFGGDKFSRIVWKYFLDIDKIEKVEINKGVIIYEK